MKTGLDTASFPRLLIGVVLTLGIGALVWGVARDEPHPHEYASMTRVELDAVLQGHPDVRERTLTYADFTGTSLDGRRVDARAWIERYPVVLFTYLAEWCENCGYEAPVLSEAYWRFADRGFRIVARSEYSHPAEVRRFAARNGTPFPVLPGSPNPDSEREDAVRTTTHHYRLREALGDGRKWGTPLSLVVTGDPGRVHVVLGEVVPEELFDFLDRRLPERESG